MLSMLKALLGTFKLYQTRTELAPLVKYIIKQLFLFKN
ncbi:hypothetical protein DFP78_105274 [Photobacterium lutimaris]|nr:hypothetical protein DFP78_105274 [Photobacterium lutimaris]